MRLPIFTGILVLPLAHRVMLHYICGRFTMNQNGENVTASKDEFCAPTLVLHLKVVLRGKYA